MKVSIRHKCRKFSGFRAASLATLYSCDAGDTFSYDADVDIPDEWSIGLVYGPSGSGKSSIGKALFPGVNITDLSKGWSDDKPIIDLIAPGKEITEATTALQAAGLGSIPSWLRPYSVLSQGEAFRAGLARLLGEPPEIAVVDEFTSVIDRQVARIASIAFAKAWRRTGKRVVLLSCHSDIIEYLQPDWVFHTETGLTGQCLRRRPEITINIHPGSSEDWAFFERHHYLKTRTLPPGRKFIAFCGDTPVGFCLLADGWAKQPARISRLVVMPEWQGIGLGARIACKVAAGSRRKVNIFTRHPTFARSLSRYGWKVNRKRLTGNTRIGSKRREMLSTCGVSLSYIG